MNIQKRSKTQGTNAKRQPERSEEVAIFRKNFPRENRKASHKKAIVAEISNNLTAMLHRLCRNGDGHRTINFMFMRTLSLRDIVAGDRFYFYSMFPFILRGRYTKLCFHNKYSVNAYTLCCFDAARYV